MRNPLSKTIQDIKPSGIRKFFDIVSEMPEAISLGVGEPDFDTPWHIREEGIYSLEKGRTFYTSNSGLLELREEICKWYKRKYDVDYDYKKEALLTVGGSEGIDVAIRAMLDPGDEVIFGTGIHHFPVIYIHVAAFGIDGDRKQFGKAVRADVKEFFAVYVFDLYIGIFAVGGKFRNFA